MGRCFHLIGMGIWLLQLFSAGCSCWKSRCSGSSGEDFPPLVCPLPASLKKQIIAQTSRVDLVCSLLGRAHESYGFGDVVSAWYFDDGSCLILRGRRKTWVMVTEHFSPQMQYVGIFIKCESFDIPCLSETLHPTGEGQEKPIEIVNQWIRNHGIVVWQKESELDALLGSFHEEDLGSEYHRFKLWNFADGMSFVGRFNQWQALESGFVFPTSLLPETTELAEFLFGETMWRRLDDESGKPFLEPRYHNR